MNVYSSYEARGSVLDPESTITSPDDDVGRADILTCNQCVCVNIEGLSISLAIGSILWCIYRYMYLCSIIGVSWSVIEWV